MGRDSKIEWCHHTFNSWIGCTHVSPGCKHCYAEALMAQRMKLVQWGPGKPRRRTTSANWKKPLAWNREAEPAMFGLHERARVFCGSLMDWLDHEVPIEWLQDLLALIAATPNLDWLLLTKRPGKWRKRLAEVRGGPAGVGGLTPFQLAQRWLSGEAPPNVWIGTSVEAMDVTYRIAQLIKIPARVRFLSCEPLLGFVDLRRWLEPPGGVCGPHDADYPTACSCPDDIQWVIVGGESGPHARHMEPCWARDLRDQCERAEVPFLFKQWGEFKPIVVDDVGTTRMERVGKKQAGRLLDGVLHDDYPGDRFSRSSPLPGEDEDGNTTYVEHPLGGSWS